MLRHLVEGSSSSSSSSSSLSSPSSSSASAEVIDSALVPAILDIFVNSVQNEDSFLFLNAVQGLVVAAQRFGRDVFKRLIEIYSTPERVGATSRSMGGGMSKQELDVKLRVGEALGEIVGRCGQALGGYAWLAVDLLLPAIFSTIRNKDLPTTLRTSCISIASRAVETAPLVMSQFTGELSSAMLDILELEHAVVVEPIRRQPRPPRGPLGGETEATRKPEDESMATTRKSDKSDSVSGRGGSGGGEGAPTSKERRSVLAGNPEPSLVGSTTKVFNGVEATVQERKGADNGTSYEGTTGTGSGGGGRGGGQPGETGERDDNVTDADPTRANAKLSPLRRSAIHFLRTVVRSLLALAGDDGDVLFHQGNRHNSAIVGGGVLSTGMGMGMGFPVRRASTVLRYLSSFDVDGTVRLMASETVELIAEAARMRMVGRGA
ncbi:hypothetical protein FRC15_002433 [Serendipita sp. 397]|nr:hypothetical protein FRC15_002433 [Serendipita sp. 397]